MEYRFEGEANTTGFPKGKEVNVGAVLGDRGDFNDIRNKEEKVGGRERSESSLQPFRNFISNMDMGEIKFIDDTCTWANNREGRRFHSRALG